MYSNSFIALKSVWIEQQTPIFDAQFFSWFVDYVITPLYNETVKSRTDCGHDFTWCGAAKIWNDLKFQAFGKKDNHNVMVPNPACVVIMGNNYVTHNDYRTITEWHENQQDWRSRASLLIGLFHSTFPSMFHDGLWDESFTNPTTWYAKSSGTCRKDSSLIHIPAEIMHSKQATRQFINHVHNIFRSANST